mgnify:CR=1 FL=1
MGWSCIFILNVKIAAVILFFVIYNSLEFLLNKIEFQFLGNLKKKIDSAGTKLILAGINFNIYNRTN